MTYSEKLRDPRWQKLRLKILERDNWRCVLCSGADKNLQVHHVVYRKKEPWDYPEYLYQTLCEDCHEERHALLDSIIDGLRVALMRVPTSRVEVVSKRILGEAMGEIGLKQ